METEKPEYSTNKVKWIEWYPTFINFLSDIPGRSDIPLSYIYSPINVIIHATYGYSIDEYVDRAHITGQAYQANVADVHTYIVKFTSGNPVAEAKLVPHTQQNNVRLGFIVLKNHYTVVGVYAINIVQGDKVLRYLFYVGEKNPHMWWDEFERHFTDAFNICDLHKRRNVHSENQKLRILNIKVNTDLLQDTKASINLDLAKTPITINYYDALNLFRNQVKQKFPPKISSSKNRRTRTVNEVGS